jgi:protein-disulfide isomerase
MPSGKRAKQQRREAAAAATRTPPPVRSKGGGGGGVRPRQASPRALAIAGGVVAVAVIAVVLGVVLSRGHSGSSGTFPSVGSCTSNVALTGACDANALFHGIPEKNLVLGKPSAPVEMEMFIDVQCPICQNYETVYLPTIVQKYIRTGKVQLHLKPWAFIGGQGSQSFSGRLGLIAASFQNKGYEYAKVLYDNQGVENSGWLTSTMMETIAASVNGLDVHQWSADVNSSKAQAIAGGVDQLASQDKVGGTPTIFIGCVNGALHNVLTPQQVAANQAPDGPETEQAINSALGKC